MADHKTGASASGDEIFDVYSDIDRDPFGRYARMREEAPAIGARGGRSGSSPAMRTYCARRRIGRPSPRRMAI